MQRNKKETIFWTQFRLIYVPFKLKKTFKSLKISCCLKYILLDVTDNTRDKKLVSKLNKSHGIWACHIARKIFGKYKLRLEIKCIEDTEFSNQTFGSSNGVTGVFMLLCAKYTNGIKLFMRRSCLSVSRPIFKLGNYPTNLDHIRYRLVKNTAKAVGKISFVLFSVLCNTYSR